MPLNPSLPRPLCPKTPGPVILKEMSSTSQPPPYRNGPAPGGRKPPTCVLLVNLGTPDAPTTSAVRRYLRQFLSDPRVVEMPRLRWWLILNVFVLMTSPRRSAARYRKIWTEEGSPLLTISRRIGAGIAQRLEAELDDPPEVVVGMRYGSPSINEALEPLRRMGCRRLLCLPIYPQYSGATTGSVFDALAAELSSWRVIPELRTVHSYHDAPGYIDALAGSVGELWESEGPPDKLVLSFHGLPERFVVGGDPYLDQCLETAALVRAKLNLPEKRCPVTFQSRFGREQWVEPATEDTVRELARSGVKNLDIMTPGFAADCVETLEEVARELRDVFLAGGGQRFRSINCLNDNGSHIAFLSKIITTSIFRWENIAKQ